MEVILKEDVEKLGHRGDIVKVAEGYGRNFLLPRKLAIRANSANKAVIDQMKAAAVRKSAKEKTGAEALAQQLNEVQLTFTRKVGEKDHLFGSVTSSDIASALEGFAPMPRHVLGETFRSGGYDAVVAAQRAAMPIGTGPYRVVSFTAGSGVGWRGGVGRGWLAHRGLARPAAQAATPVHSE